MERHHHEEEEEEEEEEETLTASQLLQLSETHLRLRNFSLSHQYALQSHHPHDPLRHLHHPRSSLLTTVSHILSSSSSTSPDFINWYSILQLDTFCSDLDLIRSHYDHLLSLLTPVKDSFPLANHALGFLFRAFSYLSNPSSKSHLDSRLKSLICSGGGGGDNGGFEGCFWTSCPYCFHVYEYDCVYEGCCLRCPNEFCRKAFHGVRLGNLPPKVDFDNGVYFASYGYFPLGFSPSELGLNGKFGSWSPVVGFHSVKVGKDGNGDGGGGNLGKTCDDGRVYEGFGGEENEDVDMSGFESRGDIGGGDSSAHDDTNDVNFFEGDGEIFVGFDPDDV